MGVEKRRYRRAKLNCSILYPTIIYRSDKRTFYDNVSLNAKDISEAGISMEASFFVPIDSFVTFFLRIEDNIPFRALVKIRWNKCENGKFISRGEFIALNLEDIHIIRNYVNNH